MPLRAFSTVPAGLREWSAYLSAVEVRPDDGSVTTAKIAALAVTEPKIANAAISSRTIIANAVTTTAIANGNVTLPKIVNADTDGKLLIRRSGSLAYDVLLDADIPATIARDTEVTDALAAHVALLDPHTQYTDATELAAAIALKFTTATYTGAFTGCTTDPAPVLRYSKAGSLVTLYVPQASATSNATGFTITGAPASIRPTRTQKVIAIVQDNGTVSIGTASMDSAGTLTLGLGITSAVFTAAGVKGVELQTVSYSLD